MPRKLFDSPNLNHQLTDELGLELQRLINSQQETDSVDQNPAKKVKAILEELKERGELVRVMQDGCHSVFRWALGNIHTEIVVYLFENFNEICHHAMTNTESLVAFRDKAIAMDSETYQASPEQIKEILQRIVNLDYANEADERYLIAILREKLEDQNQHPSYERFISDIDEAEKEAEKLDSEENTDTPNSHSKLFQSTDSDEESEEEPSPRPS